MPCLIWLTRVYEEPIHQDPSTAAQRCSSCIFIQPNVFGGSTTCTPVWTEISPNSSGSRSRPSRTSWKKRVTSSNGFRALICNQLTQKEKDIKRCTRWECSKGFLIIWSWKRKEGSMWERNRNTKFKREMAYLRSNSVTRWVHSSGGSQHSKKKQTLPGASLPR